MSGGRWERVQRLFEQALEVSPQERRAFLQDACGGEPDLAEEVAGLLAAHERAGDPALIPTAWLGALGATEGPRFAAGERIAGRYEIRGLLGRGGMGEVYEAWDSGLSIVVALKALRIAIDNDEAHRRLKMEGFLARSVWHPNVCRLYDLGRHDDERETTWFLTMERLLGVTLSSRLRDEGRVPPRTALRIVEQLAGALGAAHDAGVVHRDFKPANVIVVNRDGDEQAVVTDFGIARWASEIEPGETQGESGPLVGTPAYMAPEQVRGEASGPAADIYALGVVLYEMVTGRLPFRGGSALEVARRRLSEDPPPPRTITPELDERWEAVILRCLERDPGRRFQLAEDVAAALAGRASDASSDSMEPTSRLRYALPPERDGFVGRRGETEELDRLFGDGARLVTLVAAAGMGKTRLATHYGWRSLPGWPGGVWFCDLTEARDGNAVASAVARTLGVPLGRLDPLEQLGQAIAARGKCLLILDNFDHAVEAVAMCVDRWLERAPEASFLATGREKLGAAGAERVQLVEPLALDEAMDLFAVRSRWLRPSLDLEGHGASAAREIVQLVDCMPLAIELAAARVPVMPIPQIVETMRDRFRLLTGGRNTRHETLEIAIDGSWELLTPWERLAWAQCSVFEGGFTLEAAERVLDLQQWPGAPPVVDVLQSLVDRSVLRLAVDLAPGAGDAKARFGMYVSLQAYARNKLGDLQSGPGGVTPAAETAEQRHGRWYSRFGTDEAIEGLDKRGGMERRRTLERELPNLVAATQRALERRDGAVAVAVYRAAVEVFSLRGPFGTGVEVGLEMLKSIDLRGRERTWVLYALARMERLIGAKEPARAHTEEALALAREGSDRRLAALLVGWLGNLQYDDGATDSARALYEEALAVHRENSDPGRAGLVLSHLGILHYMQGQYESAGSHYESALELLREAGDRRREGYVHGYLGSLHRNRGRFAEALAEHTAALAIHRELGDRSFECQAVGNLGNLHTEMGHPEDARACYESAVAVAREMGDRRNEGLFLSNLGSLHLQEGRIEEARACFETALAHHRLVGTRTQEGYALGLLGTLSHREGLVGKAERELAEAEAIMREVGHHLELGKILCLRGQLALDSSNPAAARAALDEVESLATARGWGTEGELGGMIAKLREAIRS